MRFSGKLKVSSVSSSFSPLCCSFVCFWNLSVNGQVCFIFQKKEILVLWRHLDVICHMTHCASRLVLLCHRLACAAGLKAGFSNSQKVSKSLPGRSWDTSSNVAIMHFLYRAHHRFFHLRVFQESWQKPPAVEGFGGNLVFRHVSHSLCPYLCLELVSTAYCSKLIIKKMIKLSQ